MAQRAIVVGAGAIGVASAYYLHRSGWEVTVVDRGEVGRGCSWGNSCLIVPARSHAHALPGPGLVVQALRWMLRRDSPFYIKPRLDLALLGWLWRFRGCCTREAATRSSRALLSLSAASLELFEELVGEQCLDFFYRRDGVLLVYLSEQQAEVLPHELDELEAAGFNARALSRQETLDLEPAVTRDVVAGLWIANQAHGYCYGYVCALASRLQDEGVVFVTGEPVLDIVARGGRVAGVVIVPDRRQIAAELVVLAAGSWTPQLARSSGLRMPLQPAKGYSCTFDSYAGAPRLPIVLPNRRVIITPLGQQIRGGTLELAGFDPGIDRRRYDAVVAAGRQALHHQPELHNAQAWCGLRPLTPDSLPIIDRVAGMSGLIVATGHGMLGFTQSPITGKLVAELACGEQPSVPLDAFRLDRF